MSFKQGPVCLSVYGNEKYEQSKAKIVKHCTCFSNPGKCFYHPYNEGTENRASTKSCNVSQVNLQYTGSTDETDSGIKTSSIDDLKLSLSSLTSFNTVRFIGETTNRDVSFRNWCAKKDYVKKLEEKKKFLLEQIEKTKREQILEEERENFKRWLANKQIEEENKRRELEEKKRLEKIQEELKEKRLQESEIRFALWSKRKEQELIEKKMRDQLKHQQLEQERQKRLDYSAKAYEIWLQQSRSKAKPTPLNRGIESLRSSASITYINPQPWVPNIDLKKPYSQ